MCFSIMKLRCIGERFSKNAIKTYMSGIWNDAGTYTAEQAADNILTRLEEYKDTLREKPVYLEADTGKELPW
ncbi:hypothetical protein QFZ77_004902 [Paenibacillus sp. V4I3]|nr:hypothetical protein [Paenibacillus sp. V4I3]